VQPPGSGITVTKRQLVDALNEVLTSTPVFAQYCLPLLLEKLASSVVDAKIDSLRTLVSIVCLSLCRVF
jgi:DNA repair/transcription protein MET18/MMS19